PALRISTRVSVALPVCRLEKLLVGLGVPVVQKVAGLLPPKDVVVGASPRSAVVVSFTHEELEIERGLIELPLPAARRPRRRKRLAEERARLLPPQEMILVRSPGVTIARGDRHSIDAQFGELVEERMQLRGTLSIEDCSVGGYAESTALGSLDRAHGHF